jgi:hypothetical protein
VPDHFYIIAVNPHNVKPDLPVLAMIGLEVHLRGAYNVKFLPGIHRFEGCPETAPSSCFNLDENKTALIFRYDIDLTEWGPVIFGQNFVALFCEDSRGPAFPLIARQPFVIHNIP